MKKMICAMALFGMMSSANAAFINWSATPPLQGPVPGTLTGTAWLFDTATMIDVGGTPTALTVALIQAGIKDGTFDWEEHSVLDTNISGGLLMGTGNVDMGPTWVTTTSKTLITVIFDATFDNFKIAQVGPTVLGAAATPFNFGTGLSAASWQAVPEPATMALLGIGVVAVGLRRRRK